MGQLTAVSQADFVEEYFGYMAGVMAEDIQTLLSEQQYSNRIFSDAVVAEAKQFWDIVIDFYETLPKNQLAACMAWRFATEILDDCTEPKKGETEIGYEEVFRRFKEIVNKIALKQNFNQGERKDAQTLIKFFQTMEEKTGVFNQNCFEIAG